MLRLSTSTASRLQKQTLRSPLTGVLSQLNSPPRSRPALTSSRAFSSDAPSTVPSKTYVHPLTQIVLTRLQDNHHKFLKAHKLSNDPTFKTDGTVRLKGTNTTITTSFDNEDKIHYLNAQHKDRVGRFVLQENMKPAWHSTKMSPKERIEKAVTDMVMMIEDGSFGQPKKPGDADIQ
ncbi:hypothetical protein TrCOL_g12271 [Triparma columacea]|uniref:Uncharacterized protein n=1 Tax=Triparma columacea TaxID=722753 RepID=A0A9W7FWJ2_9STRA|nr:hypothetical protein TrCOL_g12271 [Triparma columacea]